MLDPLEARDLFPIVRQRIYMNHAGVAPMSERVRAAIEHVLEMMTTGTFSMEFAVEEADRGHRVAAEIIGAVPGTVALVRSTSHGLSLLASGLDWQPGDNVVGAQGEFPANVYAWMSLQDRGVEYRLAECVDGRVTPEAVFAKMDDRTRVVALSHVEFWNGYRLDVERIGDECRRRGVIFCADAIQSAGVVPVDVEAQRVDFLSAGAFKWLLGPTGIGLCYIRPELMERVRPVLVGTYSVKHGHEFFRYSYELRDNALRYEEAPPSLLTLVGMTTAIELLLEIGIDAIEQRVLGLTTRLGEGLRERGYEIVEPWPHKPNEASGIISFRRPGSPAQEVLRDLTANGIVARVHSDFVRLSPHFYNTDEEVNRVLDVLAPEGAAKT
jgi:selenocysteine lyase/cysteine desulfurase